MGTIYVFDIDGTLTIPEIRRICSELISAGEKVLTCSDHPLENQHRELEAWGLRPAGFYRCETEIRAPTLLKIKREFNANRYVYIADREQDKREAQRAGYEFFYPRELSSKREVILHGRKKGAA